MSTLPEVFENSGSVASPGHGASAPNLGISPKFCLTNLANVSYGREYRTIFKKLKTKISQACRHVSPQGVEKKDVR